VVVAVVPHIWRAMVVLVLPVVAVLVVVGLVELAVLI
jgi:hypothetical protein